MPYRYSEYLSSIILTILYELGGVNSYKLKKYVAQPATCYGNNGERVVPDSMIRYDYKPSDSHIYKNVKILIDFKLIKKFLRNAFQSNIRVEYSLTEFGILCFKMGYSGEQSVKFIKLVQMICFLGLVGVTKIKKIESHSHVYSDYSEKIEGVSKEDILKKRYTYSQANFPNLDIDENEIQEYFNLLESKKILKKVIDGDNEIRFTLDEKQKDFFKDCWIDLYSLIETIISMRIGYLCEKMRIEEQDWLILQYGEKKASRIISTWYDSRKEKEKALVANPKLRMNYANTVKILSSKIVVLYERLMASKTDVFGIQGFTELSVSLVCPPSLFNLIKR